MASTSSIWMFCAVEITRLIQFQTTVPWIRIMQFAAEISGPATMLEIWGHGPSTRTVGNRSLEMNVLIIIIILICSLLHVHGSKRWSSGTLPRALQMPGRTNIPSRWLRRSERNWWKLIQLSKSRALRRPIRLSLLFPLRRSVAIATHTMPDRNLLQPIDFGMHSRNLLKRFL